jgi:cell division protein FtsI/penicillin-binding protein 2
MKNEGVPNKTRQMLRIILAAFFVILLRVWHLSVIEKEQKQSEAERPRRRTLAIKASRGTLTDRFQIPLATNKISYNATLYFNQIAQIPISAWKEDEEGTSVRFSPRKEYIGQLSNKLGALLSLEADRIEDLIYSKASLFPHAPFLLKAQLSEQEYYQLAALEKDWPGVHAEIASERFYPKGKCGGEVLGSMGSISSKQYLKIAEEIRLLQGLIDDVEEGRPYELPEGYSSFEPLATRLQELKEKSYRMQDLVGKSGIEGYFEEELRGFYGEKVYSVDQKGKILGELPGGKEATSGKQISLTLSIELQQFAEALLADHEATREKRSLLIHPEAKQPWIKGGGIIAMDPKTGEILAMASTPRFDPNDFIPTANSIDAHRKQKNLCRWLENEKHIADLWDGKQELLRERYSAEKGFFEEAVPLTWDRFLEILLPPNSALKKFFQRVDDVKTACGVQEDLETLLYVFKERSPLTLLDRLYNQGLEPWEPDGLAAFKRLDSLLNPLSNNKDRLFAIDLCRLVVYAPAFTDEALKTIGSMKLSQYRALNQMACRLETELRDLARIAYRKKEFAAWREQHQKEYIGEKRAEEKKKKLTQRPYLDYLDRKERELFEVFWKEERLTTLKAAIPAASLASVALETFRAYKDLERPLLTTYSRLRAQKEGQQEKHLAASFYPIGGFGYSRSYAFQANAPQGSVFKLVSGYAGLVQTGGDNVLSIIDEVKMLSRSFAVASTLGGIPYLRMYKGGRLPKSSRANIGKIDLVGAIEQSSNSYFAIMAGDILKNPEELNDAARLFGFGAPTGIELIGEGSGNLPTDLATNRTGLYSTAMGQHTFLSTPLQTAVMLSAIANGGKVLKPLLIKEKKGSFEPHVLRSIHFPKNSRELLCEGMKRVLWSNKGNARPDIIRALRSNPPLLNEFLSLRNQMIGKTGTAEVLFNPNLNPSSTGQMYKHIWFGSIALHGEDNWDDPELVVVVYLRYGDSGKEAAPLAAQVINKWREIKKLH